MTEIVSSARFGGLAAAMIFLCSATPASADSSACFFEDIEFEGLQLCSKGEAEVSGIRLDFNDKVSSIRVGRGWQVEACQHANFEGWCKKYRGDVPSVGSTANDQISSYRIERIDESDPPQACFFEHRDYQGRKFCLEKGESWDAKTDLSLNDIISSITVEDGLRITVYEHKNFGGSRLRVRRDVPAMSAEWNDKITSIKVR